MSWISDPTRYRRDVAAGGLVAFAALMLVSVALQPQWADDPAARLGLLDDAGVTASVSALTFVLAQLPLVAGLLGVGHLLRDRTPVLSNLGVSLAVVGAFGHAVAGGASLVQLSMASDAAHRAAYASLLDGLDDGPLGPFMGLGLIGTVLGFLLLSIGLSRAQVGPRWVGPAVWVFLVVEFVGAGLSSWAALVSVLLNAAVMVALALTVRRGFAGGDQSRPRAHAVQEGAVA